MRFLTLPLCLALLTLTAANPVPKDDDTFHALAKHADDTALHAALHSKKEYKHGIFPHDRHALEVLRREHAEEALEIVRFALMRRQDNSTTTTTSTSTTIPPVTDKSTTTRQTDLTTSPPNTRTTETPPSTTSTSSTSSTTTTAPGNTATHTTPTTEYPSVTSVTSFTTTWTTVVTNDQGEPTSTVTRTEVVNITPPAPTGVHSKTTTGPPGLQTQGSEAGKKEVGWRHLGLAVLAGVGGLVL